MLHVSASLFQFCWFCYRSISCIGSRLFSAGRSRKGRSRSRLCGLPGAARKVIITTASLYLRTGNRLESLIGNFACLLAQLYCELGCEYLGGRYIQCLAHYGPSVREGGGL